MILAIDLGATNIRSALVAGRKIKQKITISTSKSKSGIIHALSEIISSYKSIDCICVGVASFVKNGVTKNTCNMDFSNVDLKKIIRKEYKLPVYVDNDTNCAGLAELVYGFGKGKKNFVLLTLGTGIGGAIIINGKLYRGSSFAGEPGQMLINNKRLEDLASGTAAANLARSRGLGSNNKEIYSLAMAGNPKAKKLYKDIGHNLGLGLLNISYIFDPEIFILGGGFSNVSIVIKEATKTLHQLDKIQRNIPVVKALLGEDAGLIGAALLTRNI